ncbi:MAG: hypothetical protein COY38_00185 [Candidatus Aenigmarchaeota archaeon CG_4_10_14_0_8_um_filter_37_24]|nr:MAG: hypothetical protein AUJ50_04285 [Candidatus Aenigmarchaeota archaeon CG1_02_38_14]PIW41775.1 MAG: hypothetical protein COW21_00175 [Candidatus Aenigmarchaeota archaeon CG15_BIG_FIL_POST_REV_8_21_14_020_37_27]PIX50456.1 MAG: hypothetical protein COZ52_04065 [Candidatus Aenigmarchaeota archaeon CG_4_8_14_3_um_filter_37_24]PIY35300.1 MAG: hypothetical protein COZ04_04015 [Candidatus Aenigmarchaeota archaeon CG_4_10_14_3_um_filter_37_21]PIZ36358.1 MAG: hypothetical protein COY38_00185 [Can
MRIKNKEAKTPEIMLKIFDFKLNFKFKPYIYGPFNKAIDVQKKITSGFISLFELISLIVLCIYESCSEPLHVLS